MIQIEKLMKWRNGEICKIDTVDIIGKVGKICQISIVDKIDSINEQNIEATLVIVTPMDGRKNE